MYKGASQSLQRQHAVDKPHPSRGYIDGGPDPKDTLPDVSTLSLEGAREELSRLNIELQQAEQAMAVARKDRGKRKGIGYRIAVLSRRYTAVKRHIGSIQSQRNTARREANERTEALKEAVRQCADHKTRLAIFTRAGEILKEHGTASVDTLPQDQDRDGLGAKQG